MRIGFYAPLKAADHLVPSGDRQMARQLIQAIGLAGHEVEVISRLRTYCAEPAPDALASIRQAAEAEVAALAVRWARHGRPDVLFAYHPFYKAPDLVALPLAETFALPYLTAEASHAGKRASGPWAGNHRAVERALRFAALNIWFTARDREGLAKLVPPDRLMALEPFIDLGRCPARVERQDEVGPLRLITVAMMRPGDKLRSYRFLAEALRHLPDLDWHLTIVGDGPARTEVGAAFGGIAPDRIEWVGQAEPDRIADRLLQADLFVWPGFNEAYGLCYLEAQACGLPVVAVDNAGVPSVVVAGRTGILTPPDAMAYAGAVAGLALDRARRSALGCAAADFVRTRRSLEQAAWRLDAALNSVRSPMA